MRVFIGYVSGPPRIVVLDGSIEGDLNHLNFVLTRRLA